MIVAFVSGSEIDRIEVDLSHFFRKIYGLEERVAYRLPALDGLGYPEFLSCSHDLVMSLNPQSSMDRLATNMLVDLPGVGVARVLGEIKRQEVLGAELLPRLCGPAIVVAILESDCYMYSVISIVGHNLCAMGRWAIDGCGWLLPTKPCSEPIDDVASSLVDTVVCWPSSFEHFFSRRMASRVHSGKGE
jgi:hypothetical protein